MLKLRVMGDPGEVSQFINDFKSQPQYEIYAESKRYDISNNNEAIIFANFGFTPQERKSITLKLLTADHQEIEMNLLDGQVVEMDGGITFIRGKVYDIF